MSILSFAAVAVGAVFLLLYLRPQQKEIAVLVGVCTAAVLFGGTLARSAEALHAILQASENSGAEDTVRCMLKALGIAAIGQISADICRDAGENTVGSQVEQAAKAEILLLSLPMAERLLALVREMLG